MSSAPSVVARITMPARHISRHLNGLMLKAVGQLWPASVVREGGEGTSIGFVGYFMGP